MPLTIRSALPGRVRWDVPQLLHRPELAAAVASGLAEYPAVSLAAANALTGRLLLQFDRAVPFDTAEQWVLDALDRAASAPAAAAPPRHAGGSSPLTRLIERTDRHRGLVTMTFATSFLNRLFEALPPIMIAAAVDVVTRGPRSIIGALGVRAVSSQLMVLGGFSAVLWTLDAAGEYTQKRLSAELANVVQHDLRNEVYTHLQRLDIEQVDRKGVSSWMRLLDADMKQIHGFIEAGADPLITIAANGLIVGATFLMLSPGLALVQLLMIPPLVWVSTRLLPPIRRRLIEARQESDALQAILHDNVTGLSTIAAFNTDDAEAARVDAASARHLQSERDAYRYVALYVPSLQMVVGAGFITTLVWGGSLVSRGQLTAGAYNAMAFSELRLLVALARLGVSLESYQRTKVSIERVLRVLDMQPAIRSGPIRLPERAIGGALSFENVVFGYEPDRAVLKGLSLEFPAGRTTGIVGESGAGKSTILRLLLRFYNGQSGTIRLDGVDIRELSLDDLRRAFALVPQEIVLFGGTVRDNIAYARRTATMDDVVRAAKVAEAHEFIERLPDGYDTIIGSGSRALSTGQRQRIAIARAALAERPILLFDEATSALDSRTEAAVQRSLYDVTAGRTTIMVAHRLSTVRNADHIYVLDDGQVREQGTHDELLRADGVYASMWRVQTGEVVRRRTARAGTAKPTRRTKTTKRRPS